MARDYVTIREEERDGETVWTFTSVGHDRLKSAPAQGDAARRQLPNRGRGLGRADRRVEVQDRRRAVDPAERSAPGTARGKRVRLGASGRRLGRPDAGRAHGHVAGDRPRRRRPAGAGRPVPGQQATYWESNGQITRRVLID